METQLIQADSSIKGGYEEESPKSVKIDLFEAFPMNKPTR
jgi:hypothetical protein